MGDSFRPPEEIETARLALRKATLGCAESLFAYASDSEVTRYLSWPTHDSLKETNEFLRYAVAGWDEGSEFIWTIALRETDLPFGTISFKNLGPRAEMGFVIARERWGNGYMTEAAGAVADWLLAQPSIHRVESLCDTQNVASQRVLEKVGLEREGLLRKRMVLPNISETPRDMIVYGRVG